MRLDEEDGNEMNGTACVCIFVDDSCVSSSCLLDARVSRAGILLVNLVDEINYQL